MSKRSSLRNVEMSLSGMCPVCSDLLMTAPMIVEHQTLPSLEKVLEGIFQNHLSQKHSVVSQRTGSPSTPQDGGELS